MFRLPVSKQPPPVPPKKCASQPPAGIEQEEEEESELVKLEKEVQASWKTNRPETKLAIVRPQPQVTLTHRSPSPMPLTKGSTEELRKSRLPLSTSSYRSSSTSSTTSSPLNSPTTRQPSPSFSTTERNLTKYRPRTIG